LNNNKIDHRRQEVQQIVKNACDQLNAEGVDARNYVEQLAWLFFLKAFDEAENRRAEEASFDDQSFDRRLYGEYAWSSWAKDTDHPDQMLDFVNGKLWTKLTSPDPKQGLGNDLLAQRFRRIFENVRNYCRRGVSFAKVVQQVDKLHFSSDTDVHVLSELYEDLLKRVAADSAGYAGEFYTQRHIVRMMVEVVQPKPGEKVYDPCFGTAGFLGEAADYIRHNASLSGAQLDALQKETFYGMEIKPLTYLLGTMNMILHGIEGANLELVNTLEVHTQNVSENNKYNVILSNPPYGGKMDHTMQTNFRVKSSATECLFVQHIMANLARGGRAAIVIPEGVLFRGGPNLKVRKELLEHFNLHTIISLPAGCFLPYTPVKTNVIFFNRPQDNSGTKRVWYYELTNDGFELKQTRKPIEGEQISDFLSKWQDQLDGENSWSVSIEEIEEGDYDLSPKNPNLKCNSDFRPAIEIIRSIKLKEERILELLAELEKIIDINQSKSRQKWEDFELQDLAHMQGGGTPSRSESSFFGGHIPWVTPTDLPAIGLIKTLASTKELITDEGLKKSSAKLIEPGSILYSSRATVGKIAVTDKVVTTNQGFINFTPFKDRIDVWFLAFLLNRYTPEITHLAGKTTYIEVPRKKLRLFKVSIPSIDEQRVIVKNIKACFNRIEEIEALRQKSIFKSNNGMLSDLRSSILRKVFPGEL